VRHVSPVGVQGPGRMARTQAFGPNPGRLMMLKLRRDYKEQQGNRYSLRTFHDAVLGQGAAPFWAHRRLLLKETTDASLD